MSSSFRATELGIIAQDPEDASAEILYGYEYTASEESDYFPAASTGRYLESPYTIRVYVSNVTSVSAVTGGGTIYVTRTDFDAHLQDYGNPHRTTKAQVGLGNVENKAVNDLTPTYTRANAPAAMVSGETVSQAFSKLAKANDDIISHIQDRDNPHEVSPAAIGAATEDHKHSASDITDGVLSVARGGTGVTSMALLGQALSEYISGGGGGSGGDSSSGGSNVVVGTYDGNNSAGRTINLGFTPAAVIVYDIRYGMHNGTTAYGGIAVSGRGCVSPNCTAETSHSSTTYSTAHTALIIVENGFRVTDNSSSKAMTNTSGHYYVYIAIA